MKVKMFLKVHLVKNRKNMRAGYNSKMLEVSRAADQYQPMKAEDLL